MSVNHSTLNP